MADTPQTQDDALANELTAQGFLVVHPRNPHCLDAIALGTEADPRVVVHFWLGRAVDVTVRPERIPLEEAEDYAAALERCAMLLAPPPLDNVQDGTVVEPELD